MKRILLFMIGLMINMAPAMAEEGAVYSAEYVDISHQSAVVYRPTAKTSAYLDGKGKRTACSDRSGEGEVLG